MFVLVVMKYERIKRRYVLFKHVTWKLRAEGMNGTFRVVDVFQLKSLTVNHFLKERDIQPCLIEIDESKWDANEVENN